MSSLPSNGNNGNPLAHEALAPAMDAVELTVPDLGPSVESAAIVAWSKEVGELVAADEPICRLAVDELQFEVCSTANGELTHLYAAAGDSVRSGDSLAEVAPIAVPEPEPMMDAPPQRAEPEPSGAPPAEALPEPFYTTEPPGAIAEPEPAPLVELPPDPEPVVELISDPEPIAGRQPVAEPAPVEPDVAPDLEPSGNGDRPGPFPPSEEGVDWSRWHSPVVRKLAEEHDIDLSKIEGTGIGGRVRKRDVLAHTADGT